MGRYPRDWIAVSVIVALMVIAAAEIFSNARADGSLRLQAHTTSQPAAAGVSVNVRVR
jgi:hypothetical protein